MVEKVATLTFFQCFYVDEVLHDTTPGDRVLENELWVRPVMEVELERGMEE